MLKELFIVDKIAVSTYSDAMDYIDEVYKYTIDRTTDDGKKFDYSPFIKKVFLLESSDEH